MKPNLIIAGVNKCATTSLFAYLSRHPSICGASVKEICHFLPLRYGEEAPPISAYDQYFRHYTGEKYLLEATPGYFCSTDTVPKTVCASLEKDTRILLVFREPIARFVSCYHQMQKKSKIPKSMSLGEYFDRCPKTPPTDGFEHRSQHPYRGIRDGFYDVYLDSWTQQFADRLKVLFFEDLKSRPTYVIEELGNFLELDPDPILVQGFNAENVSMQSRSTWLRDVCAHVDKRLEPVLSRAPSVRNCLKKAYASLNKQKPKDQLTSALRASLSEIYRPHIGRLEKQLIDLGQAEMPQWIALRAEKPIPIP